MERLRYTNDVIQGLSSLNTLVIIPSDYFCDHINKLCFTMIDQNLVYKDKDHLSNIGSLFLAKRIEKEVGIFFQ